MRLESISEGKAIILTPEAYTFAKHVAAQAYKRYQMWHKRIQENDPEVTNIGEYRDLAKEELVLHHKLLPKKMPVEVYVTYNNGNRTEGRYDPSSAEWSEIIEIELSVGCKNPKLAQPFLEEILIHEMTHAVDPKVGKMIPKSYATHDTAKIKGGDMAEFWKYARQPIEVEAVFYQIANRFVRHFKSAGLSKEQIIDKIRHLTQDDLDAAYKTHVYGEKLKILLGRKSYRRKFVNTLLHIANLQEGTSRQRRLVEADMSRRDFLKNIGKGAMAAAHPEGILKGLMGGGKTPRKILVSVQPPDIGVPGLENDIDNVTIAYKAAQKLGGAVGGSNVGGEEYEFFTMADPTRLNDLMTSGKLKPLRQRQFQNFNKPIDQKTLEKFKKDARETAVTWADSNKGLNVKFDIAQETQRRYEELIRQEQYTRSLMYLVDDDMTFYLITTPNEATAADYQSYTPIVDRGIGDLISDWWKSEIGDLRDYELTKPIVELIKQKRLYYDISNPFELNHLMQAFAKFKVAPPSDITQVIARLNKPRETGGPTYDEVKQGDTWESWSKRKKAEDDKIRADEKAKQKREFDEAPPSQEDPDSWRTQSVEFEHKLVGRLRRL